MVSEEEVPVKLSCEVLGVSRSGFYAWTQRPESKSNKSNEALTMKIKEIHWVSRGTYGLPRIRVHLKNQRIVCGKTRLAKLMKRARISGLLKRRFKIKTTDSNHSNPIAERVFKTEEVSTHPTRPNQVWASDISYLPTEKGFLYLATYLDLYTRKIVGFSMGDHMRTSLIESALDMALGRQGLIGGELLSHSDRGTQYASEQYRTKLARLNIRASMSRKGNCWDNSAAESFFATLKKELVYRKIYKNHEEAKKSVFEYIEVWYNRTRIHSSIGYMTPTQFEASIAA